MKRLSLLLVPFIACAAIAADPKPGAPLDFSLTLEPGKIHEECARIEAGQKRAWHWKSNAPVDFNIHYHVGNDVFHPIKRDASKGDRGIFSPTLAQDYCWMWTARGKAAKLEGRIAK